MTAAPSLIVDSESCTDDQCLGGIEVEFEVTALEGASVVHRISLSPREERNEEKKEADFGDSGQYSYFQQSNNKDQSLEQSFDSTDEIKENSNEAKLINRIAQKAHLEEEEAIMGFSENPQDVLFSSETEAKYLDVLDSHIEETEPEATSFGELETDIDDKYPVEAAGVDEIMATLLDSCCVCDDDFAYEEKPLKSALRSPKFSQSEYINRPPSPVDPNLHVEFKDVDILEFQMTLGDHPSACSGPPVRLDWESNPKSKQIALEEYENTRQPRRNRRQLKLSLQQRHNILVKERGFTFEQVKGAWHDSLEIRKQRKETLERGLAMMKWDEVWESTCRKFDRIVYGSFGY